MLQTPRPGYYPMKSLEKEPLFHPAPGSFDNSLTPAWYFSVLLEDVTIERDIGTLSGIVTFFHLRVICHERKSYRARYSGCKEFAWRIRRRFSDFEDLDAGLREIQLSPTVALPRKTFWRHLYPTKEFVKQRSCELLTYLNAVLILTAEKAAADPESYIDASELGSALPQFLGLKEADDPVAEGHSWLLPKEAEERQVALEYSLDRGVFVWGHLDTGSPTASRLRRFERQATLGDLTCTYAEEQHTGKEPCSRSRRRSEFRPESHSRSNTSSPQLIPASPPFPRGLSPPVSLLPSPIASPAQSRCSSPPRFILSMTSDDTLSFTSNSTVDTECMDMLAPIRKPQSAAAWVEADLDREVQRAQEHNTWWVGVASKTCEGKAEIAEQTTRQDSSEARRKAITEYEKAAALYRELSVAHEGLHTILGYGAEGKTFVVVQQAAPKCQGMRTLAFSQHRCYCIMGQALKALVHLHEQGLAHGHLSPECILVEEGLLGPQARIAWAPGQRRMQGHTSATLGFMGPGVAGTPAADVWAFACIILVWWNGFNPVPHPWTQYAKSHRLQKDIHEGLAEMPPAIPKALLDLHLAASMAEEPNHSFLSLLAQLLTRCLIFDPAERPTTAQLLQHRFFEQSL